MIATHRGSDSPAAAVHNAGAGQRNRPAVRRRFAPAIQAHPSGDHQIGRSTVSRGSLQWNLREIRGGGCGAGSGIRRESYDWRNRGDTLKPRGRGEACNCSAAWEWAGIFVRQSDSVAVRSVPSVRVYRRGPSPTARTGRRARKAGRLPAFRAESRPVGNPPGRSTRLNARRTYTVPAPNSYRL